VSLFLTSSALLGVAEESFAVAFVTGNAKVSSNLLTSFTPGATRNDALYCGSIIRPVADQSVTKLGCYIWPGNTGTTTVYLVEQTHGTIVAQVTIDMSAPQTGGLPGFVYGNVGPLVVTGGQQYALSGDSGPMANWADHTTPPSSPDWIIDSGAYFTRPSGPGGIYSTFGGGWMYLGVDLLYSGL
jgi:hypothetical protein